DVVVAENPLKLLKQDLLIHDLCAEVPLEHLEESDVADYLGAELPEAEFPSGLAGLIHRQSGGNALFMTAIVRDMVDKGVVAEKGGRWTLTRRLADVAPEVPATLQQMLEAQFTRVIASEPRVLSPASVAGDRFSVWALATDPHLTSDEIENACEGLAERQQFVQPAGFHELADGTLSAHYEFRHALYRESVYRRLSEVSRSRLHRLLGERLDAVLARPAGTGGRGRSALRERVGPRDRHRLSRPGSRERRRTVRLPRFDPGAATRADSRAASRPGAPGRPRDPASRAHR